MNTMNANANVGSDWYHFLLDRFGPYTLVSSDAKRKGLRLITKTEWKQAHTDYMLKKPPRLESNATT